MPRLETKVLKSLYIQWCADVEAQCCEWDWLLLSSGVGNEFTSASCRKRLGESIAPQPSCGTIVVVFSFLT